MNEKARIQFFTAVCQPDRLSEARESLRELCLSLCPDTPAVNNYLHSGTTDRIITQAGVELAGLVSLSQREQVVRALAERGIAGFSQETQVVFHDATVVLKEQ